MNYSAKDYALFLLSKRDYSVGKLKKKLTEKDVPPEEIKTTVNFLLQNNFIDDKRFAENYVRNQINIKPTGKYKLSMKLKQNFIDDDIIQKVLAEISENDEIGSARELAEKWMKQKYQVSSIKYQGNKYKIRELLGRHLIGRGFNYEVTKSITEELIK